MGSLEMLSPQLFNDTPLKTLQVTVELRQTPAYTRVYNGHYTTTTLGRNAFIFLDYRVNNQG